MKDDVEVLLEEAGARWRATQPSPDEPDWPSITTRSKTPLCVAAAAVTALVVALAVTFWPSRTAEPPAHPAPAAGLLVPAPKGAIVPAPNVAAHGQPVGSYCPVSALTGSLVFHSTVGELRLSLRPGVDKHCNLPGILRSPTALQLLDDSGRVRAVGTDPRAQFSVNPPYYGPLVLGPGYSATMYLRTQGEPPCLPNGSEMVIPYNGSNIAVPTTGPASCTTSVKEGKFWYGPFSTPGHPLAFEPIDWTKLHASLSLPATIPAAAGTVHFQVTLANRSRTQAVTLAPCPEFGMVIGGDRTAIYPQGTMDCVGKPVVIQPGQSSHFTVVYRQGSRLPAGDYTVEWAIAGSKTAYAKTTVR